LSYVTQQNVLRAKAFRSAIHSNGDSTKAGYAITQANRRRMAYYAGLGAGSGKLARLAGEQKICACFDARRRERGRPRQVSLLDGIGTGPWIPLFLQIYCRRELLRPSDIEAGATCH